jgi:hypothetical protein
MLFSPRHTVTVAGCPARFVVREPSYIEERQWADAHDRAVQSRVVEDVAEVDSGFVALCLVRIEGETESGDPETIRGPFTAEGLQELLPLRVLTLLSWEVQAAGRPKPKLSPTGGDLPTSSPATDSGVTSAATPPDGTGDVARDTGKG